MSHQSSGAGIQNEYSISNQILSSEISLWNIFDIFRVGIVPLMYISLLLITKKKILEKNSYFSFYGVIFSIIPTYLWFWLMSPTKWIRYSQHFTILVVISSLYLITMNLDFLSGTIIPIKDFQYFCRAMDSSSSWRRRTPTMPSRS